MQILLDFLILLIVLVMMACCYRNYVKLIDANVLGAAINSQQLKEVLKNADEGDQNRSSHEAYVIYCLYVKDKFILNGRCISSAKQSFRFLAPISLKFYFFECVLQARPELSSSCHWTLSITSENIRKLEVFSFFQWMYKDTSHRK